MEPIQSNKIYPIGIQNFEKMRKGGYFYVDKTALVYRLVKTGSYYFLSRPRRFGKSLLISTLEAYFQGKKELFEGLAMEKLEKDWIKRPVLHIDLNIGKYDTPDSLDKQLEKAVTEWEQLYGTGMAESTLALRFAGVVRRACEQTGQRVAILIDEYDKPMLQAIGNKALQNEFRNTLKPFYGVLKTMDGCIQFALLTGVTKFGKVSVFSDHYNLEEMAHAETYADVLNSIYGDEDPLPVIFQSGYLTIKEYDPRFGLYRLGFPNREVEEGFVKFLMPFYTRFNKIEAPFEIQKFVREIESGQPDAFFRRLQSFFADTPYELVGDRELHYQNVLFIVFKLVGFYTQVEYHTSEGRVDLVLKTDRYIYIMEFKFEGTAEEALRQIDEKHYAQPFEADGRPLFRIGVNFSARTRNIERWLIKA